MKKILILLAFILVSNSIFAQLDGRINGVFIENGKNIVCLNERFCFLVLMQEDQIIGVKKNNIVFQQATSEESIDIANAHTPQLQANKIVLPSINTIPISAKTDPTKSTQETTITFDEKSQLWKYQNLGIILRIGKNEEGKSILVYQLLRI